jgi:DNA ligase 1
VLKRKNSRYEVGKRSQAWLKVINYQFNDVIITVLRKGDFGLLLSFLDGRRAAVMEFMPPEERKDLYKQMKII